MVRAMVGFTTLGNVAGILAIAARKAVTRYSGINDIHAMEFPVTPV